MDDTINKITEIKQGTRKQNTPNKTAEKTQYSGSSSSASITHNDNCFSSFPLRFLRHY